jgi:membrane protein implicated in regulation of membrane protease activity
MLTRAAEQVAEHAKRVVKLEIDLAIVELKRKMATLGVGIGLLVAAGLLGLFGLGFMLAAIAAGIATALPMWAALLIVTFGLFLVAAALAVLGRAALQKATPPVPELALTEARLTMETLKNGSG